VLQLKGLTRLEGADFPAIFQRAQETLGPDLLRTDDFTVDPGSSEGRWFERDHKATHAVVVGVFRQPSGDQWRVALALPPVPPEQCVPTAPGSRTGIPRPGDAVLKVQLNEYRIDGPKPSEERR
jgi:type VI secretion system VasD/TssJ family lipoprotein